MLTIPEIIAELNGPLAVYGADGGGIATDIYLKGLGLRERIVCFIDPASKHVSFCGKPLLPLAYLAEHPDITVITACLNFNELAMTLQRNMLDNQLYYHASFWPFMDAAPAAMDLTFIAGHYNQCDAATFALLEALFALRHDPDISRIQPWLSVRNALYSPPAYWYGANALPDTTLTVIDAGAFNGDTLQSLLRTYGQRICRYHAFEPIPEFFGQLRTQAALCADEIDIQCHNLALYHENTQLAFHKGVPRSSHLAADGETIVQCRRLDDLNLEITGLPCLKMDVEGLELAALAGAAGFIRRQRPDLALCVYHKTNDIYQIPAYIKSLVPDYRFTLAGGVHTVCYGTCRV